MSQSSDGQAAGGPRLDRPQPPYYGRPPTSHPQSVSSLVLGVLSLTCCGLFTGVPAMMTGRKAMREIDRAPAYYEGRGVAQAGFILGIIGTAVSVLVIVAAATGDFSTSQHQTCVGDVDSPAACP